MRETLKKLFLSAWTPAEKGLLLTDVLLFGILIGWLTSPLRRRTVLSARKVQDAADWDDAADDFDEEDEEDDEK